LRKLWRAAQAAIDRIEHVADLHGSRIQLLQPDGHLPGRPCLVGEPRKQRGAVLLDPRRLLAKQPRNFLQDVNESRTPEAGFFREISTAPHRFSPWR
jgi:hypothetical protein